MCRREILANRPRPGDQGHPGDGVLGRAFWGAWHYGDLWLGLISQGSWSETEGVSEQDVDEYLAALDEPKRGTLESLRVTIIEIVPEAEQCISYGIPAFRLNGKVIAGFAAFKSHLSYFPHSGSVLPELADDLVGYTASKGTLRFAVDMPLPKALVKKLIAVRQRQAENS
jgi:uncharacterized protein YdhG (YjbR/CyaY superfamily)